MKTIEQILSEPRKIKAGFEYHENEHFYGSKLFSDEDIYEALNTSAGIDTCRGTR